MVMRRLFKNQLKERISDTYGTAREMIKQASEYMNLSYSSAGYGSNGIGLR